MGAILPALLTRRAAHWVSAILFVVFGVIALRQGLAMSGDEIDKEWKETQEEIQEDEDVHELTDLEQQAGDDSPGYPNICLLYTSPSPRDATLSRMPSSA